MTKYKQNRTKAYALLVEGASEVLAQYTKNHRQLNYPGMAKLADALAQLTATGKTLDKAIDSVVTNTDIVASDPIEND